MNFTVYRKKFQDDLAIAGWSVVLASMSPLYRLKLCHAEKLFHWTKMKESMFGTSRQGECEQCVDRHTCWHKMKNFGRKNCHRQWNSFWSEEKIPWQTEAQEMFLYHKWQVRIFNNYSSSPNGLWVNSPWGRRPNGLLTHRPWGREE